MRSAQVLLGILLFLAVPACADRSTPAAGQVAPQTALGDPRPDLSADELAAFERGRAVFSKRFKPSEGLGPLYNATSCVSCHSTPVTGGAAELYRNFYLAQGEIPPRIGVFTLPDLPSPVVPAFGSGRHAIATFTLEGGRFIIPETFGPLSFPVHQAQRNSIPILGVGMFELISDATILANADPDDLDGDGISGRANNDGPGLGRFGVKAQSNNIELFTRAPLQNQMGITSLPFLGAGGTVRLAHSAIQVSSDPNSPTIDRDGIADPEISRDDLGDLIAFTRFLAPPQPRSFDGAARRGEAAFEQIGCAKCHIPALASSRGPVRAYTDLLIHDMGPDLADGMSFGTPQASMTSPGHTADEFRTQPLWGVSHFPPFLHDGRAPTLDEAIRLHGGEAAAIRDAYLGLTPQQRDDILVFLRHL